MTSINFYERTALIKRIENNLNEINQRYFEGGHVILSVTDNGDYLTVKKQGVYLAGYDTQKLFDALEDFSKEVREFLFPYDLWDYLDHCKYTRQDMTSINFYERTALIKRIENNLNQINHRYFEVNHGILSVTDNGDYVTVCSRTGNRHFGVQNIFDALNNFSLDGFDDQDYYDIWDYLDFCKYTLPEDQNSDNELKTDDELSLSEKRQVALVDMLLSEPVPVLITESSSLDDWTISLIPQSPTFQLNTEVSTLNELVEEPEQKNEILWEKNRELEQNKEYNQTWIDNLKQRVHDLECAVYLLQQENKQLKNNQAETKPEPQPETKLEPKLTTKNNLNLNYQRILLTISKSAMT